MAAPAYRVITLPQEAQGGILEFCRSCDSTGRPALQVHHCWGEEEAPAARVQPETGNEDPRRCVLVSADSGQHAQRLREFAGPGFDGLYLHQSASAWGGYPAHTRST